MDSCIPLLGSNSQPGFCGCPPLSVSSTGFCGFFKINLFIYFWLRWVFVAARRLSLVVASGGYSLLWCTGFSLRYLLLLWSTGSRRVGFSSCGTWAQQLWLAGLVAPKHMGSSWTRARTHVLCIGRWILNHCAIREVPHLLAFGPPSWCIIFIYC